jgi:hypothetical protein
LEIWLPAIGNTLAPLIPPNSMQFQRIPRPCYGVYTSSERLKALAMSHVASGEDIYPLGWFATISLICWFGWATKWAHHVDKVCLDLPLTRCLSKQANSTGDFPIAFPFKIWHALPQIGIMYVFLHTDLLFLSKLRNSLLLSRLLNH